MLRLHVVHPDLRQMPVGVLDRGVHLLVLGLPRASEIGLIRDSIFLETEIEKNDRGIKTIAKPTSQNRPRKTDRGAPAGSPIRRLRSVV